MIYALCAIALIMLVSFAFGYVMRGFIDNERKSETDSNTSVPDHDRWEDDPETTNGWEDEE